MARLQKYKKIFTLSLTNKLDYRQEFVMMLFIGVLVFTGQYVFWRAAYITQGGLDAVIKGFTFNQIMLYYLFARILSGIIESMVGFTVSDHIITGRITEYLIKPISLKNRLFTEEMARVLIDVSVKLFFYIFLYVLLFKELPISYNHIPFFVIACSLAFIISFHIFLLSGMVAFFATSAKTLNYPIRRTIYFVSGGLIPTAFFPIWLDNIIKYLPFGYMYNLPYKIISGTIQNQELFNGIAIQIVWAILLWVFLNQIVKFALIKNESVGI